MIFLTSGKFALPERYVRDQGERAHVRTTEHTESLTIEQAGAVLAPGFALLGISGQEAADVCAALGVKVPRKASSAEPAPGDLIVVYQGARAVLHRFESNV